MALQELTLPVKPIVRTHFIVNCVLVGITLAVVALRMVARFITSVWLGWDDYLILLAVPQGIGMLVIQGLCKYSSLFNRCGLLKEDREAWTCI